MNRYYLKQDIAASASQFSGIGTEFIYSFYARRLGWQIDVIDLALEELVAEGILILVSPGYYQHHMEVADRAERRRKFNERFGAIDE